MIIAPIFFPSCSSISNIICNFSNFSGLLNRLSESNVESVTGEMSTVYHV